MCTPEIVVPPVGFPGWTLGVGPLLDESWPLGSGFSYDWFDDTWSLGGFNPITFSSFSMVAKTLPSETLSPTLTFRSLISPSDGDGISTLDLSLSIVTTGSFFFILSPGFTRISITSTSPGFVDEKTTNTQQNKVLRILPLLSA